MSFRWQIVPLLLIAVSPQLASTGFAAEAATRDNAVAVGGSYAGIERTRIAARLASNGFVLTGDIRRKGQFIVINATKEGADWRLVLDGVSGEIIGKRPVSPIITVSQ
jgi:hypothetical protein